MCPGVILLNIYPVVLLTFSHILLLIIFSNFISAWKESMLGSIQNMFFVKSKVVVSCLCYPPIRRSLVLIRCLYHKRMLFLSHKLRTLFSITFGRKYPQFKCHVRTSSFTRFLLNIYGHRILSTLIYSAANRRPFHPIEFTQATCCTALSLAVSFNSDCKRD